MSVDDLSLRRPGTRKHRDQTEDVADTNSESIAEHVETLLKYPRHHGKGR